MSALIGVLEMLDAPGRQSIVEAPWKNTRRIALAEVAWAFARTGGMRRAVELADAALAELRRGKRVEQRAAEHYAQRLKEALDGSPPADLRPMDDLSVDDRYFLCRLAWASMVLEPTSYCRPPRPSPPPRAVPRSRCNESPGRENGLRRSES